MEFKDIISVSGKPGLYQLVKPRQDGLIVSPLGETAKSFMSSRKHNFTPLENIGIYLLTGDTIELSSLFQTMQNASDSMPKSTASADDLRAYFDEVLPDYDEDKVKLSDMKKIVQWYEHLDEKELLQLAMKSSEEEEKKKKNSECLSFLQTKLS